MAKRAFHEWLEVMPSDRIMWGADCNHAEGIYGATEFTRRCLAEVLAEKVDRGDLREEHALRIGRQILRDNALALFPQLKAEALEAQGPAHDAAGRGTGDEPGGPLIQCYCQLAGRPPASTLRSFSRTCPTTR